MLTCGYEVVIDYFGKSNSMPILGALMGFSLLLGATVFPAGPHVVSQDAASAAEAASTVHALSYTVTLTGYNAVPGQTDDTPFETASGAYSNPEVVAARTLDLADELPFGTIIKVDRAQVLSSDNCGYSIAAPYIGYRVIEDSMNVRLTNRVDILFANDANHTSPSGRVRNAADALGICKGTVVTVVGFIDINHIPKTQAALVALVKNGGTSLALK